MPRPKIQELGKNQYLCFPTNSGLIEVKEEDNINCLQALKKIADDNNAVLLTLVAPYIGKKVSPVDIARARIGIDEEVGIETALEKIKEKLGSLKKFNLFLLLETPGGDVDASYKIACLLAKSFKSVTVFIIHEAASGGTLISFSGSKIKMGEMASLSPIDIQTIYQGIFVSVNMASSSLASIAEFFKTKRVEEVEYPYTALANKLDPIIYEDWTAKQWAMVGYALDILSLAKYPEKEKVNIVRNFVLTKRPHSFVILKDRAKNYGLSVAENSELCQELNCMRWWLNNYMFQEGAFHIIRFVLPKKNKPEKNKKEVQAKKIK